MRLSPIHVKKIRYAEGKPRRGTKCTGRKKCLTFDQKAIRLPRFMIKVPIWLGNHAKNAPPAKRKSGHIGNSFLTSSAPAFDQLLGLRFPVG